MIANLIEIHGIHEIIRLISSLSMLRQACLSDKGRLRNGAIIRHPLGGEKKELEVYQLFTFFGVLMHLTGMHMEKKPTYLYEIT